MTDSIAAIAARLTEVQRRTVLHGRCGCPRTAEEWSSDCICGGDHTLINLGLAVRRERYPGGIVLNAPGLAVRAHLASASHSEQPRG